MRDHRKLQAFLLADELVMAVYGATRSFPDEELFGLTSQIRRAVVSAGSNIVEGCSRTSERDFLRFLEIAHGSLREAGYQLSIAFRLHYLEETEYLRLDRMYEECSRTLAGLINKIRNNS